MYVFAFIIVTLTIVILWWYIGHKKWLRKLEETFEKHKQLGFPALTVQEQCNLLYSLDRTNKKIIETKTGITEEYPSTVLDYYITIDKDELVNHLRKKDFRTDLKYKNYKGQDACWLKEIPNRTAEPSYYLINQERGNREVIHFVTYEKFLEYFAIQQLQGVPKYRQKYKSRL
jgi:hypothetical protein